ncbi:ABC transporter ATP-binding protein [Noviherbaspirillum sedimenti]|uniref:ABC transporter ATP-binding protein n=1 Tax=Noviherbaspirillum sedimenti TaxID=2320865 RepID=A0A3A3GL37_9BURK|nr:ABC transporter ATP-binding protein [Noviherbaspirillum sedimenti]RJG01680.1 ABC transporter ATP-binding protein [Noviherbaspirillum sedimenti]
MPLLEIRNVSRRFGNLRVIDHVSFGIDAGEFFSLVGPSGCGKTTLLRMIAGFDAPDDGDILLDGASILATAPEQRPIHTVFQSYALFPHLTVEKNVAFPLQMKGKSARATRARVTEVLRHVALSDKARHFPHELSGGQRQRVALARAIADLPRVLLLDEPLAALDAKLRELMQVELIRLQRDLGITFVFVTHAQDEALAMSHRIGVMDHGRIEQLDDPARIYGFPRNKFVADFIGHCTIVEATVQAIDGPRLSLSTPLLGMVTAPATTGARFGQQGWLALRPEQLRIGRPGAFADLPNRVSGKVCDFLYVGDVTTYIVELQGGVRIEALLANSLPGRVHFFEEGEPVELAWPADVGRFLRD